MQSKNVFTSKTFWFNALTIALGIISFTDPHMLGIKPELMLWVSGVINIGLRFLTHGSVSLTGGTTDTTNAPKA